ncbi:MAG TPA: KH domain-containing protein [Bacillota bacterium]|nr:KH domain-containing protein [Bacillota bacterium]
MKALIEGIAKALVDHPEEVQVSEIGKDHTICYELSVHPEDMGKIIGKQGRIAKAMRIVAGAAATKENKRISIEIL